MKRLFFTLLSLFFGLQAFAQNGNEWVKFNQAYYKISVAKDGLYRLSYTDLQNAGFPVSSANPLRFQIFHRGVEQRIRVAGELDGVFNTADYIEFYGEKNTGVSDKPLYLEGTQPHPYYNLYSDTTAYFLTVNSVAQPRVRMELFSEVNFGLPAEPYHTDEKLVLLTDQYSTGLRYNNGVIQNTFFETGEGWTGPELIAGNSTEVTLTGILNTAQASGNPMLEVMVVGRNHNNQQVEIYVGPTSGSSFFKSQELSSANPVIITGSLNWSDIGADGRLFVRVRNASGRLSATYVKIRYPQTFNAAGATEKVFILNPNPGNKSYVEIQNAAANTQLFDITDPNNVVPIDPKGTTTLKPVIDNTTQSRKIFATAVTLTAPIKRVSFRNINPASAEFVVISNKALMKSASSYADVVKAYAGYRASAEGGAYDTLVVEMDQLYNQFNYGEISPLAITRFMKYLVNGGDPKYLFLIGKGLDVAYNYHRNPSAYAFKDLVPTAGMPASDIYFTTGLAANPYEPAVPTGRITASTPQEVAAYLNKVKEMEARPFDGLWRKELLHLSGGLAAGEPLKFKLFLQGLEPIVENYYLGGKVTAKGKSNTGFEIFNISNDVNKGLNLITLFGHSSSAQNDVNIGFASAPDLGYANKGKYPMFLINGCNAGDFFTTTTRYGEDWVNTPDKGAIGFMANTSFGYEDILLQYSTAFYSVAYGDSVYIRKGVGDVQKEVVRIMTNDESPSIQVITQAQQMLLLGDPAVSLFGANKPDYETNTAHIFAESYTPEPITALSDSFALKIIVRNFGRAKEDTLDIRVTRTLSDNTTVSYDSTYLPVLYSDTLTFNIPRDNKGYGNTLFTVTIDPDNKAPELNENNNTAEFNMLVPLTAARSLYPQGFSIVNTLSTNLVVQSSNTLDAAREFVIQLDTLDTFNSPYKQEFTVTGKIAVKAINLLAAHDTLAYYWRVRLAQPAANESSDWAMTSFTYIEDGPEGWAQVHFPQYNSNETIGLIKDHEGRRLELQETITDVSIRTFGVNHPGYIAETTWPRTYHPELSVMVAGTEYHPASMIAATPGLGCRKNTLNLIAFNKTTALPYIPVPVQYPDARACGRRPEIITSYSANDILTGNQFDIMSYITNVPVGDSVILFSLGDPDFNSWATVIYNKLTELGIAATQISSLTPGEPFIIYARKGSAPGTAVVHRTSVSPVQSQALTVAATVTGRYLSGEMHSAVIGPAVEWKKVSFAAAISEVPQTDEFTFDVIRIGIDGTQHLWLQGETGPEINLAGLDAEDYPYIQLVFHASDEINLTSPQLTNWIVEYVPAPEGVLVYEGPTEPQQLKEGETFTNTFSFMNISGKAFSDSLRVEYTVHNKVLRSSDLRSKKILAPLPGNATPFDLTYYTDDKAGLNDVKVIVNPRVLPELYYDNNVILLADFLNVEGDEFNPVMEVTVDGRYLISGDYVSANPTISIRVWDENTMRFKADTVGMEIFLKYPGASDPTRIYFDRDDIAWFAATATSDFRVEFKPVNLPEGTYTLEVMATDAKNNPSGTNRYAVNFVVLEDNSVVISKPYPNPAQGDVFFNVTLTTVTGEEYPDTMLLEIVNANGQVINTFSQNNLFIGTNVFTWKRQTAAGAIVSPGMYIYRVTLVRGGKAVKSAIGKLALY